MTPGITKDEICKLDSEQLSTVKSWIIDEEISRIAEQKRITLAKIKELARSINISIKIDSVRKQRARPQT